MEKKEKMAISKNTANKDSSALAEQFFSQVQESIQMMFDLTSRIDERVKMVIERQKEIDTQIDKLIELQQTCIHRLAILEAKDIEAVNDDLQVLSEKIAVIQNEKPVREISGLWTEYQDLHKKIGGLEVKLEAMDFKVGNQESRWGKMFDGAWKIILMIIAGYILYKLGLQSPP